MSDIGFSGGDITITGGDLTIVTGREAVRQQLALRLALQRGEWPLDLREGIPWREQVMVRNPDLGVLSALFRARIASTPDVQEIAAFALTFDRVTGVFRLAFTVIVAEEEVALVAESTDIFTIASVLLLQPVGGIY